MIVVRCPICSTECTTKYGDSPYWICQNCDVWHQHPMPPKLFIADFEGDPTQMSDADRQVNKDLAQKLFNNVMGGKPGRTLDIGCKLPMLADALRELECSASAWEAEPIEHDLKVKALAVDVEKVNIIELDPKREKIRLVSLIHTFEHLYDPVKAMKLFRHLVADDGAVFIRMPDHQVPGFERDLTEGHYSIHPFYHSHSSLLELLVQTKDTFELVDCWPMIGSGQTDFVLRPITKKPTVCLGMIVRNETRDLPRLMTSIKDAVDDVHIVDTGSTDDTKSIADEIYLDASEPDGRIRDFSKARNHYLDAIEKAGSTWVLNLDADDELKTPQVIRRMSYWTQFDVFAMRIKSGGGEWNVHRMWKADRGIRYEGRCHEYPKINDLKCLTAVNCLIQHYPDPDANQENANARNLRILTGEWEEEGPKPRTAFYLANTHRDGERWIDAVKWYNKRIDLGVGYRDEWLFAHLYMARALLKLKKIVEAEGVLRLASTEAPDWCEFRMELARMAWHNEAYAAAIIYAQTCIDKPIPHTDLWREKCDYTDAPPRLISWCHERLASQALALAWADIAAERIGGPDQEWDNRRARLRQEIVRSAPALALKTKGRVAIVRPGAIGDILMTLNLMPLFKKEYPSYDIDYFCNARFADRSQLGEIILRSGVSSVRTIREDVQYPFADYDKVISLVGYPIHDGYPNRRMERHLLQYFGAELGLSIGNSLPELKVNCPKCPFAGEERYITIQKKAGWSKYKQWDWAKWQIVEKALEEEGWRIVEIDESKGYSLSESIAIFANATLHMGIDSFCNHLTHYLWNGKRVPGVILWGSTQCDAAGYDHNINLSAGLHCQPCFREDPKVSQMPRAACVNPVRLTYEEDTPWACMVAITPTMVLDAVHQKLEELNVSANA
jgi:ADP-heptose:LPS heptosyltransferase/glycosyltransferase involved in cell wall biosynthesis